MNNEKIYRDSDGMNRHILQMVKVEPEWAANRVQEGEIAIEENEKLRRAILTLKPHICEPAMEGETDYERAVIALLELV